MATKRTRFTYTPEDHVLKALRRLQDVTGRSLSMLINEQLSPMVDDIHLMSDRLETFEEMLSQVAEVTKAAGASAGAVVDQRVQKVADAVADLLEVTGAGSEPPPSNTGVTGSNRQSEGSK